MKQEEKERKAEEVTNIVGETDREILAEKVDPTSKEVSECEIEQHNSLINPDPNSLDRG